MGSDQRILARLDAITGDTEDIVVKSGQVATVAAVIASGQSLSGAIDLSLARLVGIVMPATWTAANLTFQASYDGSGYSNLYDQYGVEYSITAAASRAILVPLADFAGIRYMKIRSGTAAAAVNQDADRTLNLRLFPL